jgi:hypothetical protein
MPNNNHIGTRCEMHPWIILAKGISSPWQRKRELPFDPWRRSLDPPALNASKIAPNCATLSASKRLGAGEDALARLSHLVWRVCPLG